MAGMMGKSNRARSTSDAALLLLWGIGLLVCHVSDRADEIDGTIAFASRGVDGSAVASATQRWSPTTDLAPSLCHGLNREVSDRAVLRFDRAQLGPAARTAPIDADSPPRSVATYARSGSRDAALPSVARSS
jgi:hypothetical protein